MLTSVSVYTSVRHWNNMIELLDRMALIRAQYSPRVPKQPPSADGGISPIRWWNSEGAVLNIHIDIIYMPLHSIIIQVIA